MSLKTVGRLIAHALAFALTLACVVVLTAWPSAQSADRRLTRESAAGERRMALVIGNNAYAAAPLRNAVADAVAVSATLRDVGFDVTTLTDVDLPSMERAVDAFAARLQAGDVALFYFSGHGVQVDGENYLVPVDFKGVDEVDVKHRSYSATRIHEKLEARARLRMVILDACRDNPFKSSRGGQHGLAEMSARGSLIAFATGPGTTASDNPRGRNGLFTAHLLETLKEPGLTATDVFRKVRARVNDASSGRQFPWLWDGLIGDFVFRPSTQATFGANPSDGADVALRTELAVWDAIKGSRMEAPFEDYLKQYPSGRFRVAAQERIAELRGDGSGSSAPHPSTQPRPLVVDISDPETLRDISAYDDDLRAAGFSIALRKASPTDAAWVSIVDSVPPIKTRTSVAGVVMESCTVELKLTTHGGSASTPSTVKGVSAAMDDAVACRAARRKAVGLAVNEILKRIRRGEA